MVVSSVILEKGLKTAYAKAWQDMNATGYREGLEPLYTRIPSTNASEKYGWFGDVPTVRQWLGDKEAASLEDYDFEIRNIPFYSAIEIHKHELDDDNTGILEPRTRTLVEAVKNHVPDLVAELIKNGDTGLAYDGSAYFANRTVNDNLLAGTGTTLAQIQADLFSARAAMMRFKSDQGRILGLVMDTVVVPAALEGTMLQAVHSNLAGASGEEVHNPLSQWIKNVIAIPTLDDDDANDWYGFCTGVVLKPFVYQDREKPNPLIDDTQVKRNGKYIFSVEMRGNAGYGMPQLGVKVVNT